MCTHSQTGAQVPLQANVWKWPDMAYWKPAKIQLIMGILVRENLVFVTVQWSLVSRTLNVLWGWGDNVLPLPSFCVQLFPCRASPPNPHPDASNTHLMPKVRNGEMTWTVTVNQPFFFFPRFTEVWTAFLFYFSFSFRRNVKLRPWPLKVIKNPINLFTR